MNENILTRNRLEKYYHQEVENYLSSIRLDNNTEQALKSVGQSMFWACNLMEFYEKYSSEYKKIRDSDQAIDVVKGIKYARHRVTHQFIQLLYATEGMAFPIMFPASFFEIRWKPLNQLPPPDKGHEHKSEGEAYKKKLEDQPVRLTFYILDGFFNRARSSI